MNIQEDEDHFESIELQTPKTNRFSNQKDPFYHMKRPLMQRLKDPNEWKMYFKQMLSLKNIIVCGISLIGIILTVVVIAMIFLFYHGTDSYLEGRYRIITKDYLYTFEPYGESLSRQTLSKVDDASLMDSSLSDQSCVVGSSVFLLNDHKLFRVALSDASLSLAYSEHPILGLSCTNGTVTVVTYTSSNSQYEVRTMKASDPTQVTNIEHFTAPSSSNVLVTNNGDTFYVLLDNHFYHVTQGSGATFMGFLNSTMALTYSQVASALYSIHHVNETVGVYVCVNETSSVSFVNVLQKSASQAMGGEDPANIFVNLLSFFSLTTSFVDHSRPVNYAHLIYQSPSKEFLIKTHDLYGVTKLLTTVRLDSNVSPLSIQFEVDL